MSDAHSLEPFAVKTYRYLRLSIVVVVLSLLASVLIERTRVSCWQESISAYFYTPVQAVFTGTLVVIGVSLIAIKGSTDVEDVLLNLAGVLAPIVAFGPTSPPARQCSSVEVVVTDAEPFIDNNVLALAVGGAVAMAVAFVVAKVMRKPTVAEIDPRTRLGLLAGAILLAIGLIWYFGFRESFLDRAHGGAAVAMFAIVGVVIVLNARHRKVDGRSWLLYAVIAGAMALSVVAVIVGRLIDPDWRHQILWLEILELSAFGVYWMAQTFEHWEGGVPTGTAR
jgi:hypothetical protein